MPLKTWLALASLAALPTACGDDGDTDTNATSLGGTSGATTSASSTDPTTTDPATTSPDDTTGDGPGSTDSSAGTDTTADSGSEGSSSGGAVIVNGCEGPPTAMDMTGMAMVELDWQLGHQRCLVVDAGTTVRWSGSLGAHPLEGGETGTQDPASPITLVDGDTGTMVDVAFDTAGDYPYYCAIHLQGMQGVIYVQ